MLVFLDACCMIYAVESTLEPGEAVRAAVLELPESAQLATTELVRFECLIQPLRLQNSALLREFGEVFDNCVFLQLGRREYDAAADLRSRHGLSSLDALHLAAAVSHGCTEFWTNDDDILALGKIQNTQLRRVP